MDCEKSILQSSWRRCSTNMFHLVCASYVLVKAVILKYLGGPPVDLDRFNAHLGIRICPRRKMPTKKTSPSVFLLLVILKGWPGWRLRDKYHGIADILEG
ncbi:hypothetical protein TNCV_3383831 [Trichonephila clavipes]|uniref:Uncharacterized protein n=1 Tax=Trichonephila clavipes TaxID=2585209 RepID=A0A8X6SUA8_TRICX|nr:hypothetical protein TNCV_3383831 [Trichonephila clavipes]